MSDCERLEPTMQAYVAGELDESGLGPLLSHCRSCEECKRLLELHRDLVGAAAAAPRPGQADFDALEARVLARIAGDRPRAVRASRSWWLLSAPRLAAVAAVVAVFVAGLWIGRGLRGAPAASDNVTGRLLEAMNADAASNRALTDVEDSRFTYSNVSFRRMEGGKIALGLDVTTHVELVESIQAELVRDVLVHSLLTPSTVGSRLKAMSYAAVAMEPKVRDALIFAMRRDDNLAVRLKALTILSDHLQEPTVETAVLAVVRSDESVQMRLVALDFLAEQHFDRQRIREVIQEQERPGDEALLVRLAEYDKQL